MTARPKLAEIAQRSTMTDPIPLAAPDGTVRAALFLDIDGVVNDADWGPRHKLVPRWDATTPQLAEWLDPARVALVDEIVDRTGALVVLISTTRVDPRMGHALYLAGFRAGLHDATAIAQHAIDGHGTLIARTRSDEVAAWCALHRPTRFVILDDTDHAWTAEQRAAWVQPDFRGGGLKREHVERCVALLRCTAENDCGQEVTRMCTSCPVPCERCRSRGPGRAGGPYCETTPCACECHERRALAVNADGSIAGHVEPDGRFMPALTDRERACLRGEHEAAVSRSLDVYDVDGQSIRSSVCRHCRAVFVPRPA